MKGIIILLVLVAVAGVVVYFSSSSVEESFDANLQGREARAAVEVGMAWTEVIQAVGTPRKWREGMVGFDFVTDFDRFEDGTEDSIREGIEAKELKEGFCFLYRYSDAVTFAVNFNRTGAVVAIRDKEGKGDLMDAGGG